MDLRFSLLGTIGNGGRIAGSSGGIFPSDRIGNVKETKMRKIMYQKNKYNHKIPKQCPFLFPACCSALHVT